MAHRLPRFLWCAWLMALAFGCQDREPPGAILDSPDLLARPIGWVTAAGEEMPSPVREELTVAPLASTDDLQGTVWRLDLPVQEIHRLARLLLDVESDAPASLRLGWIEKDSTSVRYSPVALGVEGSQTVEVAPHWDLPGARNVAAVTLHAPTSASVQLRKATLETTAGPGTGWIALNGVARRSVVLRPGEAARWSLRTPPQARLEFSYGVAESAWEGPGDGSFFQLDVARDGESPQVLWQDALNPRHDRSHRRWFAASVDLSAYADEKVDVRLVARGSPPREAPFTPFDDPRGDAPVFGAPKLVSDPAPANVLIVVIDTLRRDELGLFGARADVSPALDRQLAASAVFDFAYATGPWTHPSTASLLTGLLPPAHGLGTSASGVSWFHPEVRLLAEEFQSAGYSTAAVSNNLIVSPEEGFARGMDCFDTRPFDSSQVYGAERMTRYALEWLEEPRSSPFFLYLHYFDPHDRYQAPTPHTRAFVDPADAAAVEDNRVLAGQVNPMRTRLYRDGQRTDYDPSPADLAVLRGLYRGEIQYTDSWVGLLLDTLDKAGRLQNTVVVITADHGEEFLDHGYLKHGQGLYDELIRVPLAIRFPDAVGAGHRVDTPVSLIDVAPTLLGYCGLDDARLPGQDLHAGLRAGGIQARPVYAVSYGGQASSGSPAHGPKQAVIEGRWKLIHSLDEGTLELFDLTDDALERRDRSGEHGEVAARLRDLAAEALAGGTEGELPLTPEMLEKLKALGYID